MARIIEDQRAPVAVLGLARVFVFIQRSAVEARQPVRVAWESEPGTQSSSTPIPA